jgi:hypothetical protein
MVFALDPRKQLVCVLIGAQNFVFEAAFPKCLDLPEAKNHRCERHEQPTACWRPANVLPFSL